MAPPTSTPPATSPTGAPMPSGPLARYLAHPGQETGQALRHLGHLALALAVVAGPAVALVVLATGLLVILSRRRQHQRAVRGARLVRILTPPEVDPAGAETLWTNLVALLRPGWRRLVGGQLHLAFELSADAAGLHVALWVPGGVPPGMVERAVEAAWPGAVAEPGEALPPLAGPGLATGGALRLAGPEHFPLRTDHRVEPLRALLGALSELSEDESACVQVLARPLTGRRPARLHRAAAHRRAGRPTSRAARLLDLVTPGPAGRPAEIDPGRAGDVAAIMEKAAQPAWAVAIRYGVATNSSDGASDRAAAARLRGRAHAVASAFAAYSGRNRFDRRRLSYPAETLARRRLGRGDLVSVAELAAVAHLPTDVPVAGLARAGARAVAPPPEVGGVGKVLGDAEGGTRRPVALSVADARYHLHVMGATGSGKSTLLTRLALADLSAGRGLVVIDPKGDLVTDILDRYPDGARAPVVIDPGDAAAPPVLNVLDGTDAEHDLVVDNVVGIFRRIFEAFWGPRTDDVLRAACLTLLRHQAAGGPVASLADVPRLLVEPGFRHQRAAALRDRGGLQGFWDWYEQMSEGQRAQVVGPVMNKLRAFLLRDFVARLMGPGGSSFSMADVLDGGACLVRIPKGILGEEASRLVGSFVLAKVWQAATNRARLGQAARVDASLVVDECQNFLTLPRSFEEMLAEARGYRLSLVLAHQHLAQMGRDLREAVSANARTKIFFSMSPEDAHVLGRHTAPEVSEHDLAHLGAYQAAARLVVEGKEAAACTIRTRPAPPADPEQAAVVRSAAAAYGRNPARRRKEAMGGGRPGQTAFPGADVPHSDWPGDGAGGRSVGRSVPPSDRPSDQGWRGVPGPSSLHDGHGIPSDGTPDLEGR